MVINSDNLSFFAPQQPKRSGRYTSASITLATLRKSGSTPDGGNLLPPMALTKATCSSSVSEKSPNSTCTYTSNCIEARGPDSAPSLQGTESPQKRTKTLICPYKEKYTKAKRSDSTLTELLAKEQVTHNDAIPASPFDSVLRQHNQKDLPCFIKTIVVTNLLDAAGYAGGACLEIPRRFASTHNMKLRKLVKLQGFSEGSPVRVVACRSSEQQRQTRYYLRSGWSSFVSDNDLRLGQVLVFTLTDNSFFVVKAASAP